MMHVLKDEKLGVDREYVAVNRNAEVGETIVIVEKSYRRDPYNVGDFFKVDYIREGNSGDVFSDEAISDYSGNGTIYRKEYHVLEPTDIVHIDGERYRLEDRKAEVGDEVIYVHKESGESDGIVSVVSSVASSGVDVIEYEDFEGETVCGFSHGAYRVLTPIQDATEAQESDVITVLANLGAEVAELKRAVARHQAEINALHEDKVRLGEQLAKVVANDPKSLAITTDELAQIIVSLSRAGL
ncbi:hypothetical protein [Bacillus sp. 005/A4HT-01/001]|uniref:hypothetical protein n=1 Tax=Bacillus sp. 005/A4HT-01/001 TaxID=2509010 RepID=UPI0010750FA7|nr:hypothetical protein [Bacillus sp. 005/A4HT-01/001]TFW49234.1 hypothetical protein ES896_02110 [Bacillus sp. 005/A4HT-01/001]